ncbi:cell wall biogenesis glycosyltransferase-like protein [Streptomyces zinciresistens K42]|uniref:Cell wall biogenesis glycosyltransferase-like protein n=2 Tax=Streptomyces TaxID=1883 RepID=G2GF89_9ACTN|nr:cell wall biogenesis glycosyltransferase-like protein [Streptomyces zinciresistens K42]
MPYLTRCVTSVVEQSIGRDEVEIIVVDDGSTDGTAEELRRLSDAHPGAIRVFAQENSGGPSAPRNVGLGHARGRFVFFLDADDYLGPEALERMVAMAEENATDIVLGKMVGVGGRAAPQSMFRRDQPRADVFSSRVYWTLNPMKLFRRDLLERHGLRFPEDLSIGEDQLFVAPAYLHAAGISVLASYDCLYWVEREDQGNITLRTGGTESRLRFLPRMVDLLLESVPPGQGRDHLAHRHLTVEVQQLLGHLAQEPRPEQEKALSRLAETIAPLWHEGIDDRLSAMARLRLHLIRHRMLDELLTLVKFERELARGEVATPVLVEDGRALARYPFLRDADRAVPDRCYDVTAQLGVRHQVSRAELTGTALRLEGHAYLHRVGTEDVTTELVLRERDTKAEHRLPVTHTGTPGLGAEEDQGRFTYGRAGFEAVVDIATAAGGGPLPGGLWDISLAVGAQGISKEVRIGSRRAEGVSGAAATHVVDTVAGLRAVTLYTTAPHGNFTLDLDERKHAVTRGLRLDGTIRWASDAPAELEFSGRCALAALPPGTLGLALRSDRGDSAAFPVTATGDTFTVRVPVSTLPAGVWRGELRLGDWALPLPALPGGLAAAKWSRRALPWYAKRAPAEAKGFALVVARTSLTKAVTRLVRS